MPTRSRARNSVFLALVPDGECKHAAQLLDAVLTALLVEMNDDLGVGLRLENVALAAKRAPQFLIVINLAVEDDPDASVLIGKRLVACIAGR